MHKNSDTTDGAGSFELITRKHVAFTCFDTSIKGASGARMHCSDVFVVFHLVTREEMRKFSARIAPSRPSSSENWILMDCSRPLSDKLNVETPAKHGVGGEFGN